MSKIVSAKKFGLGKPYKLCSQQLIQHLFEERNTVKSYPFICHYKVVPLNSSIPFQFVISAPKRTFRKAVARNRIKRISKESIRKSKSILENHLKENNLQIALFITYTSNEELPFEKLEQKTIKLFNKIINAISHD